MAARAAAPGVFPLLGVRCLHACTGVIVSHHAAAAAARALQALLLITTEGSPQVKAPARWSSAFKHFLQCSLHVQVERRATAEQLLMVRASRASVHFSRCLALVITVHVSGLNVLLLPVPPPHHSPARSTRSSSQPATKRRSPPSRRASCGPGGTGKVSQNYESLCVSFLIQTTLVDQMCRMLRNYQISDSAHVGGALLPPALFARANQATTPQTTISCLARGSTWCKRCAAGALAGCAAVRLCTAARFAEPAVTSATRRSGC